MSFNGSTWTGFVGLVGLVLSLGFTVPQGLGVFHILAAGGMMAGSAIGRYVLRKKSRSVRVLITTCILSLIFLFICSTSYYVMIHENYSGWWIVFLLGFLITVALFCLAVLMEFAGVLVDKAKEP